MPATASSRPTRIVRSASFRLTLLYVALFSISVAALFALTYWAIHRYALAQLDTAVSTEAAGLEQAYRAGGLARVVQNVREHLASRSPRQRFYYLLARPDGSVLAGDLDGYLERHRGRIAPFAGWRNLPVPPTRARGNDAYSLRARGQILPDGTFLLVAADTYHLVELDEVLAAAFGWGSALTVILAIAGGLFMSMRTLRRIETINRTAAEIMAGNLERRIASEGTDDEFDRLAASLNSMLDRIQHLMEGMRQVSNDIAHDLRTPLGHLRQRLEHAQLHARTLAEYETAVGAALGDIDCALDTFSALLRIAQIEAGTRRARFAVLELSAVLANIVEAYETVAEEEGRTLQGEIEGGVQVAGDRDLLLQMFANLVENAIHHTPPGARIDVRLASSPDGPRAVVADSGPGIPAAERANVFRRFYRLDAARSTPGSGLGLSIVAAVAELHGARIELADNHPGLRVTLHFPPAPT